MTLDELNARKKKLQAVVFGLGIVMLLASAVLIYVAFTVKGMSSLAVVAMCCAISFLPALISIAQINAEIKSRNA